MKKFMSWQMDGMEVLYITILNPPVEKFLSLIDI